MLVESHYNFVSVYHSHTVVGKETKQNGKVLAGSVRIVIVYTTTDQKLKRYEDLEEKANTDVIGVLEANKGHPDGHAISYSTVAEVIHYRNSI